MEGQDTTDPGAKRDDAGDASPSPSTGADGAVAPASACTPVAGAAVGDWSLFGNGQCLIACQSFYPAKFGLKIPTARNAWTGDCAPEGACHIWVDDIPDPATWERIANDGAEQPSTYDLIVFPPFSGNPYGHIASVDRVERGEIYVMDSNYAYNELRAPAPHTVGWKAYGWYHLKSRDKTTWCP